MTDQTQTLYAGEFDRFQFDMRWNDTYAEVVVWDRLNPVTERGIPMAQIIGRENIEAFAQSFAKILQTIDPDPTDGDESVKKSEENDGK